MVGANCLSPRSPHHANMSYGVDSMGYVSNKLSLSNDSSMQPLPSNANMPSYHQHGGLTLLAPHAYPPHPQPQAPYVQAHAAGYPSHSQSPYPSVPGCGGYSVSPQPEAQPALLPRSMSYNPATAGTLSESGSDSS